MDKNKKIIAIASAEAVISSMFSMILFLYVIIGSYVDKTISNFFNISISYNGVLLIIEKDSANILANILLLANKTILCFVFYLVAFYASKFVSKNNIFNHSATKHLYLIVKNICIIGKTKTESQEKMSFLLGGSTADISDVINSYTILEIVLQMFFYLFYSIPYLLNYIFKTYFFYHLSIIVITFIVPIFFVSIIYKNKKLK